jgi:hypothetical protein
MATGAKEYKVTSGGSVATPQVTKGSHRGNRNIIRAGSRGEARRVREKFQCDQVVDFFPQELIAHGAHIAALGFMGAHGELDFLCAAKRAKLYGADDFELLSSGFHRLILSREPASLPCPVYEGLKWGSHQKNVVNPTKNEKRNKRKNLGHFTQQMERFQGLDAIK